MKPFIYKVRPWEYLYLYHEKLPWAILIDGFHCLCHSWQEAIEKLQGELKQDETPLSD